MQSRTADTDATPDVLDPAGLASVRADIGEQLFAELVGMFDIEQARRVAMLREAMETDDRKAIAFQAHVLRGAGGYLAATRLSEAAAQLEREAKVAGPLRLERLVGEVIDLAENSFIALRKCLEPT